MNVTAVADYTGLLAYGGFTGITPPAHHVIAAPEMSTFFLAQHLEVAHRHARDEIPVLLDRLCGRVSTWLPTRDVAVASVYTVLLQRSLPDLAVAIAWATRLDVPVLTAHRKLIWRERNLRELRVLAC